MKLNVVLNSLIRFMFGVHSIKNTDIFERNDTL
jgi:hypothetical protein